MHLDFLRQVFQEYEADECFAWRGESYRYEWLLQAMEGTEERLGELDVPPGSVAMLHSDFSPYAIATLLCLIERGDIIVPLAPSSEPRAEPFAQVASACFDLHFSDANELEAVRRPPASDHVLYAKLRSLGHPGLVLFSSGSTGEPKGVVHDLTRLLRKYRTRRQCHRTLAFLLFDHIGGIDTALYSLSNGSSLVLCDDRSPERVCRTLQDDRVEVLPAAPAFLNLLSLSGAWRRYDLSRLKIVTYGAEVMPESTLRRCEQMFPGVTLLQKYGTSEVGTLRSRSRSSDSLWVRVGGEGYQTRVRDGKLEIKAESSMLGYLNAESPFTDDGWFMTGDSVEVDGDFIRFLGRDSDVINVGGQKVHPAEVEAVIGELDNIAEVAAFGEANALMGQVVCARVRTVQQEDGKQVGRRVRAACRAKLEKYKVPMRVEVSEQSLSSDRFKRLRDTAPPK